MSGIIKLEKHGEGDHRFLRMTITNEGKAELQALMDNGESIDSDAFMYDLLETHTCTAGIGFALKKSAH